jgi:hypothetical protein
MEEPITIVPQMLNETQVARALAVTVSALRRWRSEGRGPEFVRIETCVRYDVRAIEKFLSKNLSNPRTNSESSLIGHGDVGSAEIDGHRISTEVPS